MSQPVPTDAGGREASEINSGARAKNVVSGKRLCRSSRASPQEVLEYLIHYTTGGKTIHAIHPNRRYIPQIGKSTFEGGVVKVRV